MILTHLILTHIILTTAILTGRAGQSAPGRSDWQQHKNTQRG